jgi:hypothetical protein
MSWKPIDDTLVRTATTVTPNDNAEPVSILFPNRVMENTDFILQNDGRTHIFTYPLRYHSDINAAYRGLAIHTSPYTWRGIPLPFNRSPRNSRIKVHVLYQTKPSLYSSTEFGGKVDLWLDDGTNRPTNIPFDATSFPAAPVAPFTATVESSSDTYSVIELNATIPNRGNYEFEGEGRSNFPILWIRSKIGEFLSDLPPIYIGNGAEGWDVGRRTSMELPLSYAIGLGETKPSLTGRLLYKINRPIDGGGRVSMLPYAQFYYVEHENRTLEEKEPGKVSQLPIVFTYPTFPEAVYRECVLRNARRVAAGNSPAESFDAVFETTGIRIASITVTELP